MSYILWYSLINTIVFKWGLETRDLGEYTFALGQVQHNIYNFGNAKEEHKENIFDSQALGIEIKQPMPKTYTGIGSII